MASETVVYVVDDDQAVRTSMRRLIGQVDLGIETFSNATDFLENYSAEKISCLILDVRMPGMSGIDLQKRLIEEGIEVPVIIVTGHGDIQMAVEAVRRGAINFLEKPFRAQVLLDSIQHALDKDRLRRQRHVAAEEMNVRFALLTEREREVVNEVVAGKTNKEIAKALGVTPQAIDARRSRAMSKLGVGTVPQLVECVLRHEWGQDSPSHAT